MRTRLPLFALPALVALALTACSVTVQDAEDPTTSGAAEPTTSENVQTDQTDQDDQTDQTDQDEASAAVVPSEYREQFAGLAGTVSCGGGSVQVDQPGVAIEITEDCDSVTLTAAATGSVVLAQGVGTLMVDAAGVSVVVAGLDDLTLTASATGSLVIWESGDPSVDDQSSASSYGPSAQLG